MKKGKTQKAKKYLSIMFIPHFSGKVKVIKLSSFYSKTITLFLFVSLVLTALGFFIADTIKVNNQLKKDVSDLYSLTVEQKNVLMEKDNEVSQLKQKDEVINNKIKEFNDKYKEITDNYITNRTGTSKPNRSGDRTDKSFIDDIKDLKGKLDKLDETNSTEKDASAVISDTEARLKKYTDSLPTLWPTSGRISSPFGGRPDPFRFTTKFHEGLDIAATYGNQIAASGSGQVIFSGWISGYGNVIIIDHGHGISTLYGHCSKLVAKKNQAVKKGALIALVGSSGRSTGAHLHFEIRQNDDQIDPIKYLDNN